MSDSIPSTEGTIKIDVPNARKPCETWYRIYGDLKSGIRPLIVLHGGPGGTSEYKAAFSDLTVQRSRPVIIYDQPGCGRSTYLQDKNGDTTFWTEQLFLDQLKASLEHLGIYDDYNLAGHSQGGMLGARHTVRQSGGLRHLVIASSPISMDHWVKAQNVLEESSARRSGCFG
ncbi:L-amino acid amidase [Leucoagaricus sp. SymC.cos]|nr:L-amino acid amidase [Leucoagaricus sp. SymC.cos]